jgi:hypothetical protein
MRTFLMSFFIFLFVVGGTKIAYAEWLDHQTELTFGEIEPLHLVTHSEVLRAPEGQRLVPTGAILGIHDVDVVVYTYLVPIETGSRLEVTTTDVTLTKAGVSAPDTEGILVFAYEVEVVEENLACVKVTVRMNMPVSETQYELLQGSTAAFKVVFDQIPIL